jgi:hypothetical protein
VRISSGTQKSPPSAFLWLLAGVVIPVLVLLCIFWPAIEAPSRAA